MLIQLTCPYCGTTNNLHRHIAGGTDDIPQAGDMCMCWVCRHPSLYVRKGDTYTLRRPTAQENNIIKSDPRVRRLLGAMIECYLPDQVIELMDGQW